MLYLGAALNHTMAQNATSEVGGNGLASHIPSSAGDLFDREVGVFPASANLIS